MNVLLCWINVVYVGFVGNPTIQRIQHLSNPTSIYPAIAGLLGEIFVNEINDVNELYASKSTLSKYH
jgi:hypothetical protein